MKQDILATKDYENHHTFYFSLVISLFITLLTWLSLIYLNPFYSYMYHVILCCDLYHYFLYSTLINNIYQVVAHIFPGTKFMGYYGFVPAGSADNQRLSVFTVSNIFDILGWLTIFIYYERADPFLCLLASVHYGSGIVSIFFNKTFQKYYIENGKKINNTDTFGYIYWRIFRIGFVFTDALARGYMTYLMINKL